MKCDCFIGFFSWDEKHIHLSTLEMNQEERKYLGISLSWNEILDGRRGHTHTFNYCPFCGKKIDWNKIKMEMLK